MYCSFIQESFHIDAYMDWTSQFSVYVYTGSELQEIISAGQFGRNTLETDFYRNTL